MNNLRRTSTVALTSIILITVGCDSGASQAHSVNTSLEQSTVLQRSDTTIGGATEDTGGEPGEVGEGYPFNENPFGAEGKEVLGFNALSEIVGSAAIEAGVAVTLYNPTAAEGSWRLFFTGRSIAAVGKDFTIVQSLGTLTSPGADALVDQAAKDPPGSPEVTRQDLSDGVPCILTDGDGSFDLMCGGSASVVVDFLRPPRPSSVSRSEYLAGITDAAKVVMATGRLVGKI